ncbi:MAG: hypothetical protein IPN29_21345 [Saprospiraceae bacterium]|nr:hypothetical protein [Saprospiraceae bacterium]
MTKQNLDGTITIGRFFNIPLKLHWTFGLLLAYVVFNVIANDSFALLAYVFFYSYAWCSTNMDMP